MTHCRYSSIAVMAMAVALGPAAAIAAPAKLMPQASETAAPKAKGPKPYQASMLAVCAESSCQAKFGKKSGKVRHITNVSCLMVSSTGVALGALIRVDDAQISYLPFASRAMSGAGEYASGAVAIDFDVLGGEVLTIELASSDTASAANCIVTGTIE